MTTDGNLPQRKRALVTGITGQDGFYMSNFLLNKGYDVYGMYRRNSTHINERSGHLDKRVMLVEGDVTDFSSIARILQETRPHEVYNFAAQSLVPSSWASPIATWQTNAIGPVTIMEAIKVVDKNKEMKFFQASTSEMFGKVQQTPQNEKTPFYPRSPYGDSKVGAYWATVNFRESYDRFACSGITFNHESPRRGHDFVTRKITSSAAKIKLGIQDFVELGNLDSKRDWGFAGDYVEAMWMMLQRDKPEDYVISSGQAHSVREFAEIAFRKAGIPVVWHGERDREVGTCNGKQIVRVSPKFYRPAEVDYLEGDSSKIRSELGWKPRTSFEELIVMMVESDLMISGGNLTK